VRLGGGQGGESVALGLGDPQGQRPARRPATICGVHDDAGTVDRVDGSVEQRALDQVVDGPGHNWPGDPGVAAQVAHVLTAALPSGVGGRGSARAPVP
jgi:hypothetical protein